MRCARRASCAPEGSGSQHEVSVVRTIRRTPSGKGRNHRRARITHCLHWAPDAGPHNADRVVLDTERRQTRWRRTRLHCCSTISSIGNLMQTYLRDVRPVPPTGVTHRALLVGDPVCPARDAAIGGDPVRRCEPARLDAFRPPRPTKAPPVGFSIGPRNAPAGATPRGTEIWIMDTVTTTSMHVGTVACDPWRRSARDTQDRSGSRTGAAAQ